MKDLSKMIPIMRRKIDLQPHFSPIASLTSTLDTEITCTVCKGLKLNYQVYKGIVEGLGYCFNCQGTGKMPSRTSEEQWKIDHGNRI